MKRLAPTASTAGTCLSVVDIGNAPMPLRSTAFYLVNCFQKGILELTVLWGSVPADFRPFHREVGEGVKRGRKVRDRHEE